MRARCLTLNDFAVDERTEAVDACPAGYSPRSVERDAESGTAQVEMPALVCAGCAFREP